MKIGITFPQTEIGSDAASVRDFAQAVEGMGFDYLLAYDHVLGANPDRPGGWKGPYTHQSQFHEVFVLFGYLAGLTERIQLVTGVLILPQRQTALVAKQAAEVDVLSGGRLRLGVGLGWNEVEYVGLNENFRNRGKRIEEQIHLLRALWTQPLVTFDGDYHALPDAGLNPMPIQRPIPIWFGAREDMALRRAARIGDGWITNPMPTDQLRARLEFIGENLEQAGRSRNEFGIDVRYNVFNPPADGWEREAARVNALGVTHICLSTMGAGYTGIDQHLNAARRFKVESGL